MQKTPKKRRTIVGLTMCFQTHYTFHQFDIDILVQPNSNSIYTAICEIRGENTNVSILKYLDEDVNIFIKFYQLGTFYNSCHIFERKRNPNDRNIEKMANCEKLAHFQQIP